MVPRYVDGVASRSRGPASSLRSLAFAVAVCTLIMAGVSLFVRTMPTVSYRAGYDAALGAGRSWIDGRIGAAGVAALSVCEQLHTAAEAPARIDYGDFIDGCSAGIDEVYGRHVPVLAAGR